MSKGVWHSLAVIIVALVAGPELMMSMELMAMIELLGASTFVLMYFSGVKLLFTKLMVKYQKFERHSVLFVPSISALRQMPSLALHAIPERTVIIGFLGFIILGMSCLIINMSLGI
ncbi:hypothetical protein [Thalassotalea sp. G2M2-11]|uniref:hypothetical protein n=1 Tax=Thalassotalea sp. G2M2-11 TaxID=2787627 RepID=UPI0019D14458|nr:hypothetical protein [Thalassotalea sp. G2M2-11]